MFKVAIFDLDGTLLNTIDDLANACNYALSKFSFPTHESEKYKTFIGNGLYKLVERALPLEYRDNETINMVLDVFNKYYNEHMMDMTRPYNGVMDLLDHLIDEGIGLAVVSNKKHDFTLEIIHKYFCDRFKIVLGLRENYKAKPDPTSLLEVINELGVNYACLGDFETAIKYFKKGFEASKDVEICTNIVMCYLNLGDKENAKLHLDIAKKLNSEDDVVVELDRILAK